MSSREHPIVRPTARVLLIGPEQRTLLLTVTERDEDTGKPFWFSPGGGLEGDETYEEAAGALCQERFMQDRPLWIGIA